MLIDDYITSGKYNLGTLRLDLCISLRVIFEDLLLLLLFIFLVEFTIETIYSWAFLC